MLLAHGIGGVEGLPLDGELVLQTGGVVVLVSFLAVALLWRRPRFTGPVTGRPLPAVLDAPAVRTALQALTLALGTAVVAHGLAGPQDPDANPAPRALYVLLWVGLVPASLLFGPVWRVLNPLRLLHRAAAAVLRRPVQGSAPMPAALGYLPAAAGLLVFVWLELVAPDRDRPAVVAGFLLLYAVVNTGCALRFGERWFARGDAFEVYSTLTGALAPFGRLGDGRIGLRNPFRGLAAVRVAPGLVAFVSVWWGSTVFDGLSGWTGWRTLGVPLDTLVLVGMVLVVGVLYRAATGALAGPLASTLVPIAAGYTIAHYAVLLLVEGPRGIAQLAGQELGPVSAVPAPGLVAGIQIAAVLAGHVVAVVAAHDRSVALLPEHRRLADQVPLVLLMVAYTMAGLFLLVIS
ncbi:hypothetical protein GCM10009609_04120 [Pseudonocardia aurantiaca]|uniref:Uncharacterized protein n=1 Tax=Pseudonocardia aurantiaca TaxID=75290 RepID=A0ABW4FK25_9PSEU